MDLPQPFLSAMQSLLGEDAASRLVEALAGDAVTSVRHNPFKPFAPQTGDAVPWATLGRYLPTRMPFTLDPLFHAGAYYVQEASSMFLEQAVRQYVEGDVVALDLCAAPGGKSTHLRSLLSEESLLVANEVVHARANVLRENLTKWGDAGVVVTESQPHQFSAFPQLFDLIVADVPCSGEGMFRKDAGAIAEWSVANVGLCAERQREIVADVWGALKENGLFVYSTCTFNPHEDEENVAWIARHLGAEVLPLNIDPAWQITGSLCDSLPVYHFFPHKTRGEGFFLAVLRKRGGDNNALPKRRKEGKTKGGQKGTQRVPAACRDFLTNPAQWEFRMEGEVAEALPLRHAPLIAALRREANVLQAGVPLGEVKGKDIVPHHAVAMSRWLNSDCFAKLEVEEAAAIAYLRHESLPLATPQRGYLLVTFRGVPLGFAKAVGNRANNLYPAEWRIRKSV